MPIRHVVVDGSNIATEGRSTPSFKQLKEAVAAFTEDHKSTKVTVVVDASFEHRVDAKERRSVELAEERGEIVAPPAGAIGRGDAFLLKIAAKTGATVLSNDSFQEFHDQHKWLFETERLIGGKPVPNVGWVFTERAPVRVRTRAVKSTQTATVTPEERVMDRAIVAATKEIVAEATTPKRKNRTAKDSEPVNEPLVFIQFIADHRIGSEVRGLVDRFTAHGAFVSVGSARCYIPLTAMGSPTPRSPRSVLNKGERRTFLVKAVNPGRRDIELMLPPAKAAPAADEKAKTEESAPKHEVAKPTKSRPKSKTRKQSQKVPARKKSSKRPATRKPVTKKPTRKATATRKKAAPTKRTAKKVIRKSTAKKASRTKTAGTKKITPSRVVSHKKVVKSTRAKKKRTTTAAKPKSSAAKKRNTQSAAKTQKSNSASKAKRSTTKKTTRRVSPTRKAASARKKEPRKVAGKRPLRSRRTRKRR